MVDGAVPRFWREIPQRYNLIANQCQVCSKTYFPPRESCPYCRRKSMGKMVERKLSGKGKILTYTIIHEPPYHFIGKVPYPLAIIKLDEGPKVTAQLVDIKPEDVRIDMRVQVTFRKIHEDGYIGAIHYGYKFKPVEGE